MISVRVVELVQGMRSSLAGTQKYCCDTVLKPFLTSRISFLRYFIFFLRCIKHIDAPRIPKQLSKKFPGDVGTHCTENKDAKAPFNHVASWEFPGGPVARIPSFHCRGHRFDPLWGN